MFHLKKFYSKAFSHSCCSHHQDHLQESRHASHHQTEITTVDSSLHHFLSGFFLNAERNKNLVPVIICIYSSSLVLHKKVLDSDSGSYSCKVPYCPKAVLRCTSKLLATSKVVNLTESYHSTVSRVI